MRVLEEVPTEQEAVAHALERQASAAIRKLRLIGVGANVWVTHPGKAVRYQWEDGSVAKTILAHRMRS